MMIAVASFKGGVGKTTTAVHLAGAFAAIRRSKQAVLLIDGDPNRSASRWAARGDGFGFEIMDERTAQKMPQANLDSYEHVVIDTEAHPSIQDLRILARQCAWIVVPSIPDAISIDATAVMAEQLAASGIENWKVLMTICPRGSAAEDTRNELTRASIRSFKTCIPRYVAFQKAHWRGCLVAEVSDPRAELAWDAYRRAAKELL
jgi:chromosome partitioning protein